MPPPTEMPKRQLLSPAEIDEYGELDRRLKLTEPDQERLAILKEKFQKTLADAGVPADMPYTERGRLYELRLGTRRNERTITNKKKAFAMLKNRLGINGLIALISIPLGEGIDKHLTKSEQTGIVAEERSGYRKLDVVALAAPAPDSRKAA